MMTSKNKNVQIPLELFLNCYLLLCDEDFEDSEGKVCRKTKDLLEAKFDAIIRHDLYSQYKTAETKEERERARLEYLDRVGMFEEWRRG